MESVRERRLLRGQILSGGWVGTVKRSRTQEGSENPREEEKELFLETRGKIGSIKIYSEVLR